MMVKRNLTLMLIAAALALAGLGHYYLLYHDVYIRDAAVFYAVAALLLFWAYRRSGPVPERRRVLVWAALRRLGAVLWGVLFRGPSQILIGVLAAVNGLAALIALLLPAPVSPLLALLVALLWAGGAAAMVPLVPWPRWERPKPAPVSAATPVEEAPIWLRSLRGEFVKHEARIPRFLLIVGLGSALVGQFCFFYQREHAQHVRNGVFFWCVAMLSFGLLLWMERLVRPDHTESVAAPTPAAPEEALPYACVEPGGEETLEARQDTPVADGTAGAQEAADLPPWVFLTGLPLAVLAQYVLTYHPDAAWIGAAGYLVALVLLVAGLVRLPRRLSLVRRVHRPAWTLLLVAIAAGLVAWAAYQAHVVPSPERNYNHAALFWIAGVALAVVALRGPGARRQASRGVRREIVTVALLVIVALALRLIGLAQFPDVMSGDEGSFAMEAQRIMQGDLLNPFGTGWFSNTTGFFYLQAAALRALGWNLFALRFPSALLGALGVAGVYLLARWTFGRETAWVSALFLAGWAFPLHFSRLGFSNGADPFFGALAMAFLQRGLVRGRRRDFIVAGLAVGLSLYSYIGSRLLVVVVLAALFFGGAARLRRRWRGLLTFAVVALLVSGPLLVYFVQQPGKFTERHAVVGLFQSGQLAAEQQATGKPLLWLLLEHLGSAMSVFIYTRDQGYFYRPAIPMLYVFSGPLFVLGVGLALWHWREVRYRVILAWIGLTVVFAGWLLVLPPHYDRYIVAAPAVCLLVGRAAVVVLRRAARLWGWRPAVRRGLLMLLAVMLMLINAGYYFTVYRSTGAFHWDRNTVIADRTARLMADLGPDYTTYFFGTHYMPLSGFSSARFLAREADWMDVLELSPADWGFVKEGRGAFFVVIPERQGDLPLLRERFPGGEEQQVMARDGSALFVTYRVDSADT